jgi:hypothetical protein
VGLRATQVAVRSPATTVRPSGLRATAPSTRSRTGAAATWDAAQDGWECITNSRLYRGESDREYQKRLDTWAVAEAVDNGVLPGCVLLVCPRPQCLAEDQICETDRAERWNELEYSLTNGSLVSHDSGGGHYEHTGFGCQACGHPVTMPVDLVDDMDCV